MLELLEAGQLRAIGTSNFTPPHLQRLIDATGTAPHVNQLQCNPWITRHDERAFDATHGIVTASWGPLGRGRGPEDLTGDLLTEPAVLDAARAHDCTPGQVVLRWHLQLGIVATVKSGSSERIRENLAIDDLVLNNAQMASITALDRADAGFVDPDRFGLSRPQNTGAHRTYPPQACSGPFARWEGSDPPGRLIRGRLSLPKPSEFPRTERIARR